MKSANEWVSEGETVNFSMRIQLLVSKLGRSSKPSPRYLVVVSSKTSGQGETLLTPSADGESCTHCHYYCPQWCHADGAGEKDSSGHHQDHRYV